jgi:hypothetical protein
MKVNIFLTALLTLAIFGTGRAQLDQLKQLKGKTKNEKEKPTQGVTGPLHTKYMNKIVFAASEEAIEFHAEKENEFLTKFNFNASIYLRVYLSNSVSNMAQNLFPEADRSYVNDNAYYSVKFYIDGILAYSGGIGAGDFNTEEKQNTTFRGALLSERNGFLVQPVYMEFLKASRAKLTHGNHQIRMDIAPCMYYNNESKEGAVAASGEFTLFVGNDVVVPDPCILEAALVDAKAEASIREAYRRTNRADKIGTITIIDPKWTITRNEYTGVILKRSIRAVVSAKLKNGKCEQQCLVFEQEYDGIEYQAATAVEARETYEIPCTCIK